MPPPSENSLPPDNEPDLDRQDPGRFEKERSRLEELRRELSDPETGKKPARLRELSREYSRLEKLVSIHDSLLKVRRELDENKILAEEEGEEEFLELVRAEIDKLEKKRLSLQKDLEGLMLPPDPGEGRNIIVEIRAGTGGEEAALFAADLFRMYSKFAEKEDLKLASLDTHPAAQGGIKEVVFSVTGEGAYRNFKYESGVHRVQRVPKTESQGRIHTSAATVAVLPEAEEVEVEIDPRDLRIDTFCSSGPGGQSVNTTYSAVRITHLPSGLVVSCQDEKSQHKNKASALKVLRARLFEKMRSEREEELSRQRKSQIKSGDRSDKIRTYNFPQNRVTDHRVNFTLHRLADVIDGDLEELVKKLRREERRELLAP